MMTDGDRLARMLETQDLLQVAYGHVPRMKQGEERGRYVAEMGFALMVELGEAAAKIDWKSWQTSKDQVDRELYLIEMIDALHFWMNMILLMRGSNQSYEEFASELFGIYLDKSVRNARRQTVGYDGHSTKCERCGHALDDRAEFVGEVAVITDWDDHETTLYEYRCGSCGVTNGLEEQL